MTKAVQDIIAGVEVLTIVTECYGGGGPGGTDKRGETKMTVLVGESGAISIMDAIDAAGFVIATGSLHVVGIGLGGVGHWPQGMHALRMVGAGIAVVGVCLVAQASGS